MSMQEKNDFDTFVFLFHENLYSGISCQVSLQDLRTSVLYRRKQ